MLHMCDMCIYIYIYHVSLNKIVETWGRWPLSFWTSKNAVLWIISKPRGHGLPVETTTETTRAVDC